MSSPNDAMFANIRYAVSPLVATNRSRSAPCSLMTAAYSRHTFVWLSFRQDLDTVIAGFEACWVFFGGVFKVVIPDNMATIVTRADATAPMLNQAFVEYAQARGFLIDPARVRSPQDKPRVERVVPFVRNSFFAGETFIDLADAQRRADGPDARSRAPGGPAGRGAETEKNKENKGFHRTY